ncbi:Fur family transcriptional regulator [Enterococcus xiangfangensis]|uniref:Fur family transcriptional regulator n=1 Tax=Enterococcus xiangfangensis TaxID=1296537 RepID=A0ABU3FCQ1_9ENTE|nr:Fur family transcriptional regulator [Enterococcus xiangfangensis]MBM7711661.1 Fur family peroxide stress response transcriptional regulator [Enterococcus xiangfangensis]MDT2760176.1 Fur family transcriptional regulator [Enterococcus xiangfangensis]
MVNEAVDQAVKGLKASGVRITPQRYAILEYLIQYRSHPTADEIFRSLESRFQNMSVATVYNNLRKFVEIGIVQEMNYGDAASRFDYTNKQHYHAICTECGKIVDFFYPGLEDVEMASSKLTGYQVNKHRLEVYGLCPDCQKKAEDGATA